jgi:hypothetical protein
MRARAMTCGAQLSCRSPLRLSRCRRCCPLEASIGLVPASAATEASLTIRTGSPLETSNCAAQMGPTPGSVSKWGACSAGARRGCARPRPAPARVVRRDGQAAQATGPDVWGRSKPPCRLGESQCPRAPQALAHALGSRDEQRVRGRSARHPVPPSSRAEGAAPSPAIGLSVTLSGTAVSTPCRWGSMR